MGAKLARASNTELTSTLGAQLLRKSEHGIWPLRPIEALGSGLYG